MTMTADTLRAEFSKRGPWITRFVIEGVELGGEFDPALGDRVGQFCRSFPEVRTILELGPLEGGHTFDLAQRPGVVRVLAAEARAANIARAKFVQELLAVRNVEFVELNVENADLTVFGNFDAVFCSGVLYHLPEPWKLVAEIRRVTSKLFIWTHYVPEEDADVVVGELHGQEHLEGGPDEPLSGMSPKSLWLTLPSIIKMLESAGFDSVRVLASTPEKGIVSLAAWSSSG
jgi:SAM-dependent methyltransferase